MITDDDISTGGLRDRLIRDALYLLVKNSLTQIGWFQQPAAHRPITMVAEPGLPGVEVPVNTLAVSREDIPYDLIELGSQLSEERHVFYIDFYAQSDALGEHVAGDIRDVLRGRMPVIGRDRPTLDVFDRTQTPVPATPAFVLELDDVAVDRAPRETARAWEAHWFMVRCVVIDVR